MAEDEDHDVCFRQPVAPEEVAACVAAMAACPAEGGPLLVLRTCASAGLLPGSNTKLNLLENN